MRGVKCRIAPTSHVRKINSRPGINIYAPLQIQDSERFGKEEPLEIMQYSKMLSFWLRYLKKLEFFLESETVYENLRLANHGYNTKLGINSQKITCQLFWVYRSGRPHFKKERTLKVGQIPRHCFRSEKADELKCNGDRNIVWALRTVTKNR